MPHATVHPDSNAMSGAQQQQTTRPPLRRAVYIHVSDLTSAYNIDHKKLEQELARVKVDSDSSPSTQSTPPQADEGSVASMAQKRLQPPRGGFNLCVLVGKVNIVVDKLRVDRSRVRLAEVEVGDETGTVSLRARDDQIDVLAQVSKMSGAVVLRNCTLELFQGKHIRLAVTKWGKLSVFPDDVASTPSPPSKINRDRNFSLIDLSLVASEMVENQPPEGGYPQGNRETATERNKGTPNRQPFQPPQYHQPRRSQRDRRQSRPNRGVAANPLAVAFPEVPMAGQMRYHGIQGYGYGDPSDMPHYPYGAPQQHHRPPEMQHSAHQFLQLQQQQYEMQQRHQMQQMQAFHEQQQGDRHRTMLRQMHSNQVLVPSVLGSPSFDSGQRDFPSLPGIVPMHGGRPIEESSRNVRDNPPREGTTTSPLAVSPGPDAGPWGGQHSFDVGMDESIGSSGMNPQATVFAPSFVKPPGPAQPLQGSPYQGFNPYDQRAGPYAQQQHTLYTQNIVYVPVPGAPGPVVGSGAELAPHEHMAASVDDKKGSEHLDKSSQSN